MKYKGINSEWKKCASGVPQGTKFGPVGFIVLVNEMLADLKFVDDSTLIECSSDPNSKSLSERGQQLAEWARLHKMRLNPKKTTELRITFKRSKQDWSPTTIDGETINPVKEAKLLGFTINDKLTWEHHIEKVIKKSNQRIHFVKAMLRARFPKSDIVKFFCASIRSLLEYGAALWHFSLTKVQSNSLEMIQRRVLKIIEGIPPSEHSYDYNSIMQNYQLTSLESRRLNLCKKTFEMIVSNPKHQLYDLIPVQHQTHSMMLRHRKNIRLPAIRTNRLSKSFSPSAIKNFA